MSTPYDTAPKNSSNPEHIDVTLQQHTSCSPTESSSPVNLSPIPKSTSSPATSANSTQHPIVDSTASSTESDPSRSPTVSSHKTVSESSSSPETVLAAVVQNSRPTRTRTQPSYLKDYQCTLPKCNTTSAYPMTDYLSFDKFTPSHKAFLAAIVLSEEPKSYSQAKLCPK